MKVLTFPSQTCRVLNTALSNSPSLFLVRRSTRPLRSRPTSCEFDSRPRIPSAVSSDHRGAMAEYSLNAWGKSF